MRFMLLFPLGSDFINLVIFIDSQFLLRAIFFLDHWKIKLLVLLRNLKFYHHLNWVKYLDGLGSNREQNHWGHFLNVEYLIYLSDDIVSIGGLKYFDLVSPWIERMRRVGWGPWSTWLVPLRVPILCLRSLLLPRLWWLRRWWFNFLIHLVNPLKEIFLLRFYFPSGMVFDDLKLLCGFFVNLQRWDFFKGF